MTRATVVAPCVRPDFEHDRFLVASGSGPGHDHIATVHVRGREVRVSCTCTAGRMAQHGKPVPCRHARAVCELLEVHGLAFADPDHGRWLVVSERPVAA